jgi:hypothetical protein
LTRGRPKQRGVPSIRAGFPTFIIIIITYELLRQLFAFLALPFGPATVIVVEILYSRRKSDSLQ